MCAEEAVRKSAAATAAKSNKAGGTAPIDLDPNGGQYLTLDPIAEATTFIHILHAHAPHNIHTWQLSMKIARRKQKWLLAWRAIRKANQLQPHSPDAHYELMALVHAIKQHWDDSSDIVRQIIQDEWTDDGREGSIQHADVSAINQHFLHQHSDSIPHRLAGQTHHIHNSTHGHICGTLKSEFAAGCDETMRLTLAVNRSIERLIGRLMQLTSHCHYH